MRHLCVALTAVLLASCGSADTAREAVISRDSAGIRIVESARPRLLPGSWRVSAEPVLSIGAVHGDSTEELVYVSAAIGLPDGGVVVVDRATPFLRWYDAAGKFVRGAGRQGGGPAEFRSGSPSAMWVLAGDSIATWEHGMPPRILVFGPDGAFARSFAVERSSELGPSDGQEFAGVTSAGFVTRLYRYSTTNEQGVLGGIVRDTVPFFGYRADGSLVGTLARRPGSETYLYELPSLGGLPARGRSSFPFALAPVSRAAGNHLYYGSGDGYEIEVYGLDGALERLQRKQAARRPVTDAVREAWTDDFLTPSLSPEVERGRRRTMRTLPFPDSMPAYRRMRVDSRGLLWVSDHDVPGESTVSWSVFDADGRWLTDVQLPTAWRIFEIGADYILVMVTDELDVQYVQKFALARGEP